MQAKHKKYLLIISYLIFIISPNILAQNILQNPGFEIVDSAIVGDFFEKPLDWNYIGSPDFYQRKNKGRYLERYGVPHNKMGYRDPKDGDAYIGIYLDPIDQSDSNIYCEYIYAYLPFTLEKDNQYYLEFYAVLSDKYKIETNTIGAFFSKKKIDNELKQIFNNKHNPFSAHIYSKENLKYPSLWQKISGIYKSKGDESHLYIGSFLLNDSLEDESYLNLINKKIPISYAYIDNIYLAPLNKNMINFDKIQTSTNIILTNIFFEFDKSVLLPHSVHELNQLAEYLKNNSNLKINIYGHTDNIGTEDYNLKLSEARAKSVADYLKIKRIKSDRIQYKGYGASRPISSNNTDNGREKNRRVEFEVY